jgi:hypothetical protein
VILRVDIHVYLARKVCMPLPVLGRKGALGCSRIDDLEQILHRTHYSSFFVLDWAHHRFCGTELTLLRNRLARQFLTLGAIEMSYVLRAKIFLDKLLITIGVINRFLIDII